MKKQLPQKHTWEWSPSHLKSLRPSRNCGLKEQLASGRKHRGWQHLRQMRDQWWQRQRLCQCHRPKYFLYEVQKRQWKWTALLNEIQQLGIRNSQLGSGRRWLGFVELKTGSRFKKIGNKSKSLVTQQRYAPLWSLKSRNHKLTLTYSPDGCGLEMMLRKTSENVDSPTDQWQTWQKLSGASRLWFSSVGPHRKFGIRRRLI